MLSVLFLMAAAADSPASEPTPEAKAAYERVLRDDELTNDIGSKSEKSLICMAKALRTQDLTAIQTKDQAIKFDATMTEAGKRCGFDAEIQRATASIKSKFPDMSDALAKQAAEAFLGQMMFFASMSEGTGASQ